MTHYTRQGELPLHELRCSVLLTIIEQMEWRHDDPIMAQQLRRDAESRFIWQDFEDSVARMAFLRGRKYDDPPTLSSLGSAMFYSRVRAKTKEQLHSLFQLLLDVNRNTRIEETRFFGTWHGTIATARPRRRAW